MAAFAGLWRRVVLWLLVSLPGACNSPAASTTHEVNYLAGHPPMAVDLHPRYVKITGPWYNRFPDGRNIELVYQRPHGEVKGIVFYAHGCSHQATDLFTAEGRDGWSLEGCKDSYFSDCLGLPGHIQLRQTARQRGYLLAAVSGGSGRQSCWNSDVDVERVRIAIEHVRVKEELASSPLLLFGFDSGAEFIGKVVLANIPHVLCLAPMNSGVGVSSRYPPSLPAVFQHMPRNAGVAAEVRRELRELRRRGVRTLEIEVQPAQVTTEFLIHDGFGLQLPVAEEVVFLLRAAKLLDEAGYLRRDPRETNWPRAVAKLEREVGGFGANTSRLSELLNGAFAHHALSGRFVNEVLDFCEGSGSS